MTASKLRFGKGTIRSWHSGTRWRRWSGSFVDSRSHAARADAGYLLLRRIRDNREAMLRGPLAMGLRHQSIRMAKPVLNDAPSIGVLPELLRRLVILRNEVKRLV